MRNKLWIDPHPVIEEHYHIRELLEAQEVRTAERHRIQERKKFEESYLKDLKGFPEIATLDFYCTKCKHDFIARAQKELDSWDKVAYYKTKHTCGTWSIRHITDRFRDNYFARSRRVAYDRYKNHNDLLQPFETGFNMVHGKK